MPEWYLALNNGRPMLKLAEGVYSSLEVKRSSPTWQAAYRLSDGAEPFNQWRDKNPGLRVDLSNLSFRRLNLSRCRFDGVKLKEASFENVGLEEAVFRGANLNRAKFASCNLLECDFKQARLARADFSGQSLDAVNFYETIRDNWIVNDVRCSYCWITKNRPDNRDNPDRFAPGEFEAIYGGFRFKIRFPGGMQPIDLLALPYYANQVLRNNPRKGLVLLAIRTAGETGLEFRVEEALPQEDVQSIQEQFETSVATARDRLSHELLSLYQRLHEEDTRRLENQEQENRRKDELLELTHKRLLDSVTANQLSTIINAPGSIFAPGAAFRTVTMSNENQNFGQAGIVGNVKHIEYFQQLWTQQGGDIALPALAAELAKLRQDLRTRSDDSSPERDIAIGSVAAAEKEARANNGPGVMAHLKTAGEWTLKIAKEIGVEVAASAIKKSLGMGDKA